MPPSFKIHIDKINYCYNSYQNQSDCKDLRQNQSQYLICELIILILGLFFGELLNSCIQIVSYSYHSIHNCTHLINYRLILYSRKKLLIHRFIFFNLVVATSQHNFFAFSVMRQNADQDHYKQNFHQIIYFIRSQNLLKLQFIPFANRFAIFEFDKQRYQTQYTLLTFPSIIYIYCFQQMIQEANQKEARTKLRQLILKHLNDVRIFSSSSKQQEITKDVYEHLMVSAVTGDNQAIETLILWYRQEKHLKELQKVIQNDFFEWLFTKAVTQRLFTQISIQSKMAIKIQDDHKQQKQIKIEESNEELLFDVVNLSESFRLQQIKLEQLNQQDVMLYTDEQMMNQLKYQLQATPSKTVGGKTHHSEHQQSLNLDQIPNSHKFEHSTIKSIEIVEFQQIYEQQDVALASQIYGHFLYGDNVEQIIEIFYCQKKEYIIIKWRPRSDGFQPKDSALLSQTLKYHCPKLLISFYQRRFPFLTQ